MTIALVGSAVAGGLDGATTASISTTGATLLAVLVANHNADNTAAVTVTDSLSNTWVRGVEQVSTHANKPAACWYYAANPTVGAAHTFTVASTGTAPTILASAWSGVAGSAPLDVQAGGSAATGVTSAPCGATGVTPSANNALVLSGVGIDGNVSAFSAAGGNTLLNHRNFVSGAAYGVGATYSIQTTATAVSSATALATWTTAEPVAYATMVFLAAGAALSSGTPSLTSVTNTTINVTCGAATGGTSPYTYQWYRSTSANFTPGAGNLLTGATSLTLADSTGLSAETAYFYKCVSTGNAAATTTSTQIAGALLSATLVIGCLGDSITKGTTGPAPASITATSRLQKQLQSMYTQKAVTVSNQGVDSKGAVDFAADTGSIFTTAKAAFASAGCTHVMIMLGTNDAAAHRSAAQFKADLQTIIGPGAGSLVTAGYTVILNYPTYIPSGANGGATDEAATENMRSYLAEIDSLVNGTTILRGDSLAYRYFVDHQDEVQTDKTHLLDAGNISLAGMWARAFDRAVLQVTNVTSPLSSKTVTLTLVNESSATQNSLTGLKWAWWDQATPNLMIAPACSGSAETTDGSGVVVIPITTSKSSGGTGWLVITNSDGTATQSPAHRAFSGPVVID